MHTGGGLEPWIYARCLGVHSVGRMDLVLLLNDFGGSWEALADGLTRRRRALAGLPPVNGTGRLSAPT